MYIGTDHLSLGLVFPIEAYKGGIPDMIGQVALAQQAEEAGFHSLWVRDIPLYDPQFGDAGQVFDPWVYLTHIAAHTKSIKLGTASIVLPLRHPIHLAKSAASIDMLYPNRLHLGIASGDRPIEYPAFKADFQHRGQHFRDHVEALRALWGNYFPSYDNHFGQLQGSTDLLPKPERGNLPLYVTGRAAGQKLEWIAKHADGWMYYPRDLKMVQGIIADWERALEQEKQERKPYIQSLYIDLVENPDALPQPIHLGFRLGRNYLLAILKELQKYGVNHVILATKFASRPLKEVIQELKEEVLPYFPRRLGVKA